MYLYLRLSGVRDQTEEERPPSLRVNGVWGVMNWSDTFRSLLWLDVWMHARAWTVENSGEQNDQQH